MEHSQGGVPLSPWETVPWMISLFRERDVALYGCVSAWSGFRFLAGVEDQESTWHADGSVFARSRSYTLGHRSAEDVALPFLWVTTSRLTHESTMPALVLPDPPRARDGDDHPEVRFGDPPIRRVHLRVDGEPRSFRALQHEDRFAASCSIGEVAVLCTGIGIDLGTVELERIEDIEPYVGGYTRMLQASLSPRDQ